MDKKIFFILFFISKNYTEFPLYVMYSPSHQQLLQRYFLPSLKDNFDLRIKIIEQSCPSAEFK